MAALGDLQHQAFLLADVIEMADHLVTESDAPKRITDMSVSLIMVAREMSRQLANGLDDLRDVERRASK